MYFSGRIMYQSLYTQISKIKTFIFLYVLLGISIGSAFSQHVSSVTVDDGSNAKENIRESIQLVADPQLAMSVPDYPVTAGDVYHLAFSANGASVQYTIPVDLTYKIRVANLGVLLVRGLTYNQLKQQVELLVNNNYPMSGVQFVLSSPAVFLVSISGEVRRAYEEKAWALTRLSAFVTAQLTPYSSTRDITVTRSDGKTVHYDLFKAQRGDFSQDPYLRPGDKIILNRAERKVSIQGAVERGGTYELLEGENLKDLVTYYANGLTEYADTSRMVLRRTSNSMSTAGDTVYLPEDALDSDFVLQNDDVITVPSRTELRDTMFFEGAVGTMGREVQNGTGTTENASNSALANSAINRIPVSFLDGENLAALVRREAGNFFPTSDLRGAYLVRNGEKLPVNIEDCLYKRDYMSEYTVQKDDTLFVPYLQNFSTVLVTGEVKATAEIDALPLKRLSTIVHAHMTDFSSLRRVSVKGIDGTVTDYDIFLANRFGDTSQNPYVKAGETVILNRLSRRVTIGGAVERSGTYELLEGENLKNLIEYYGNGFTEYAEPDRMVLRRTSNSSSPAGDTIYITSQSISANFKLETDDVITVPSRTELRDTMFFEGAVGAMGRAVQNGSSDSDAPDANSSAANSAINRIPVSFLDGENLAALIRRNAAVFFPTSDLRGAYLVRGGEKLAVNIEDCLYTRDYMSEYTVQKGDTLFVPYMQHFSTIMLIGEVTKTVEVPALPLKRLSTLVSEHRTEYGSLRHVSVKSIDGIVTDYDLFQADRFGDMSQNPYIKAGETVIVNRFDRRVTINGAVERGGTYELLPGENLKELVEYYGNGLAPLADPARIELYRQIVEDNDDTEDNNSGIKMYLEEKDIAQNFNLLCYDSVTISSYAELRPTIFVEGAIKAEEGVDLEASTKMAVGFNLGEDYGFFVRRNRAWFTAVSDVENAYIFRNGEKIMIDLKPFLYDATMHSKVAIEKDDTLMIPFRQYFISVSGAVKNPGRYPYIPDRSWDYYIGLAGGFVKTQNAREKVTITDVEGKKYSKKTIIQPEMTIEAATNSKLFYFNQYAPVVTTLLSIVATSLSLLIVAGAL